MGSVGSTAAFRMPHAGAIGGGIVWQPQLSDGLQDGTDMTGSDDGFSKELKGPCYAPKHAS